MKKQKSYNKRCERDTTLWLLAVFLFVACKQEVTEKKHLVITEKNIQTEIKVPKDLIHLGKVKRYDSVAVVFKIVNIGKTPLQTNRKGRN